MADHRERMERQKHGEPEPGSKEAEVFLLQQVMEKRTGRQVSRRELQSVYAMLWRGGGSLSKFGNLLAFF